MEGGGGGGGCAATTYYLPQKIILKSDNVYAIFVIILLVNLRTTFSKHVVNLCNCYVLFIMLDVKKPYPK